jgi:hypothetical protein
MSIRLLLVMFAFVLFVLAALGVPSSRYNLTAAGLACAAASMLFP